MSSLFLGICLTDLKCISLIGGGPDGGSSYINSWGPPFRVPPTAPPTCSARGVFVCAAVPPSDNGGPGLLTMAPTSVPTYYTLALWDRFPEMETRVSGSVPVSWMREKAGKETEEGDWKEEAQKCLWGKTKDRAEEISTELPECVNNPF